MACQHRRLLHRFEDGGEELFCPDCGAVFFEVEDQIPDPEDEWWEDLDMGRPIVDDPFPPLLSELDLY